MFQSFFGSSKKNTTPKELLALETKGSFSFKPAVSEGAEKMNRYDSESDDGNENSNRDSDEEPPSSAPVKQSESQKIVPKIENMTVASNETVVSSAASIPAIVGKQGWIYREIESQLKLTETFAKIWISVFEHRLLFSDHMLAPHESTGKICAGYIDLKRDTEVKIRYAERLGSGSASNSSSKTKKYCFQLKDGDISIVFGTETESERDEWLDIIRQAITGVSHALPLTNLIIPSSKAYLQRNNVCGTASVSTAIVDFPRKAGYLRKTSSGNSTFGLKSVKKRYFRLEAGELRYYEDEDVRASKLKDTVDLNDAFFVNEENNMNTAVFEIQLNTGRVMRLDAASGKIATEWRDVFSETFVLLRQQQSAAGSSSKAASGGANDAYRYKRRRYNVYDQLNEEQKRRLLSINNSSNAAANNSSMSARKGSLSSMSSPQRNSSISANNIPNSPKTPNSSASNSPARTSIFSRTPEVTTEVVFTPPVMSQSVRDMLKATLSTHFLIKSLADINPVIDALQDSYIVPGQIILWQGSVGDKIYVLESGQCEVIKDNVKIAHIYPGKTFGELALLNNTTRQATIRATHLCRVWHLDRMSFRTIASQQQFNLLEEKIKFLKTIKLFEDLIDSSLEAIADVMVLKSYSNTDKIIKQGDAGDAFYMILSGRVVVTQSSMGSGNTELTRLGPGKYFGELALLEDSPRKATVTATTNVQCWTVDRVNFLNIFGSMGEALKESMGIKLLKTVKILETLSEKQLHAVSRCLIKKTFIEGVHIIKQGDIGDCFYLLTAGEVTVQVNHINVATLGAGSFFGEMSLLSNERRSATVIANIDTECLLLNRADFDQLLGPLDEIIKAESKRRNEALQRKKSEGLLINRLRTISGSFFTPSSNSPNKRTSNVNASENPFFANTSAMFELEHLDKIRKLGTGTFSTVYLINDYMSSKYYAMKVLHKQHVITMLQEENIYCERDHTLKLVDCPHVVSYYATLQDEKSLYIVMQHIPGGDLWSLLYSKHLTQTKLGGILPNQVMFYLANVLTAVYHMHEFDIVHRDLKLENLMVDSDGFVKVIDLGCSKKLSIGMRSNTLCGCTEYMAPEMILSKGHDKAVDYWALGILAYELLTRSTPFYHNNLSMVYQNIIESQDYLPEKCNALTSLDANSKAIIMGLLQFKPHMRLGMLRNGIDDIWTQPFFKGVTRENIEKRSIPAPFMYKAFFHSCYLMFMLRSPNSEVTVEVSDSDVLDLLDDPDDIPVYTGNVDFSTF